MSGGGQRARRGPVLRALPRLALLLLLAAWAAMGFWQTHKPLPPGTQLATRACPAGPEAVNFIADVSAADAYGRPVISAAILDEVLHAVRGARRFIVLDYARLRSAPAAAAPPRRVSGELTSALLEQRRAQPQLVVLLLLDPANEAYGRASTPELDLLRANGIAVVPADLDALRDANLLFAPLWRLGLRWWPHGGALAAQQLRLKADHRKLLLADDGRDGLLGIVSSANMDDAQSGWSNLAARVRGPVLAPLLAAELTLAQRSGWRGPVAPFVASAIAECSGEGPLALQVLTEGAIGAALGRELEATVAGDAIDIAAYALAERATIEALLAAARRGVRVRLILDPQEDARSTTATGLPNQPVASALVARSGGAIQVRWYRTHGEHFHGALALVSGPQRAWLMLGSANFTRRSLGDYDLEADVAVRMERSEPLAQQALGYFDALWSNRAALGIEYTADFAAFADPSQSDYWLGRVLEGVGVSAF
ncbi:MAG: phospholipase [Gammaproteobacteria bacterium]|nr:phospholipase [Gammaproteobacteria bacterium]